MARHITNEFLQVLLLLSLSLLPLLCLGDSNEREKLLERGNIIVERVQGDSGIPGLRASFLVNAQRDEIWSALVDYNNFMKIFKGIDRMEVVKKDVSGATIKFWIHVFLKDFSYVLHRKYDEPGHMLTWKRLSGDLKRIHGSWKIIDTHNPTQKLVIYESFVDVGFTIVTRVARMFAMQAAKSMAQRLREWIEKQ